VNGADSVTAIVSKAMSRTPDPRLRELMDALVRHLHAFVRETKITEEEFYTPSISSYAWDRLPGPRRTR
jgi:catechol 1,2-dioxygenase